MMLLTLRGTPTLYYGDELGMTNVPVPPERQKDPFGIRVPGLGRDGCRTPMQWNVAPHAGFASPEVVECWLPPNPNYRETNVERQLADPTSFLNLYRSLLAYRKSTPALQWGSYRPLDPVADDCYIYLRQAERQKVLVALNFSEWAQTLDLSAFGAGLVQVSTYMDRERQANLARLVLRPYEGLIVEFASNTEDIS
jgi:alpha-glucosidase